MNGTDHKTSLVKKASVWYADLSPAVGSEQGGLRPVVIVQNDKGNRFSSTIIAVAMTSVLEKTTLPTHVAIPRGVVPGITNSLVLCEQVRTLDKRRLREMIGIMPSEYFQKIEDAIKVSFDLI